MNACLGDLADGGAWVCAVVLIYIPKSAAMAAIMDRFLIQRWKVVTVLLL